MPPFVTRRGREPGRRQASCAQATTNLSPSLAMRCAMPPSIPGSSVLHGPTTLRNAAGLIRSLTVNTCGLSSSCVVRLPSPTVIAVQAFGRRRLFSSYGPPRGMPTKANLERTFTGPRSPGDVACSRRHASFRLWSSSSVDAIAAAA